MNKNSHTGFTLGALLALGLAPSLAHAADPLNDPDRIITLQVENDAISVPGTDELYTSGERIGYVTPTGQVPGFLSQFGHFMFGPGSQRMEFDLQQVIHTPSNTQAYDPNPKDMPYSGQITLHMSLIQDTTTTRSVAGVAAGIIGPAALGQSVQNGFHHLIGDKPNNGWGYQLHNEPTLDLYASRTWRDDLLSLGNGALGVQLLPQISAQAGNTQIFAEAGAILRVGQGLDSDYGPAVISPIMSGTDAYTPTQPLVWYIFGGGEGRLVGHDIYIQGNTWRSSRHANGLVPLQGDLEAGAAVIVLGVRITMTEVFTTPQFHGSAPAFQYGSIAVSGRF